MCCSRRKFLIGCALLTVAFMALNPTAARVLYMSVHNYANGIMELWSREHVYDENRIARPLRGKRCLVTGSSSGLGKALSTEYVALGCDVLLLQRSGGEQSAIDMIEAASKLSGADGIGTATFIHLDLADFDSIDTAIEAVAKNVARNGVIDVAVMNAGVVPLGSRRTKQNFDLVFGVNYLGHFHLTEELIKRELVRTTKPGGKILMVSSEAMHMSHQFSVDDIGVPVEYSSSDIMQWYGQSKLLQAIHMAHMGRTYNCGAQCDENSADVCLCVAAYDPGAVATKIAREAPEWMLPVLDVFFAILFRSPEQACKPLAEMAYNPLVSNFNGLYRTVWLWSEMVELVSNESFGEAVYEKSKRLVKARQPPV